MFAQRAEWSSTDGLLELLPMLPALSADTMAASQGRAGFRCQVVQAARALAQLVCKNFQF